MRTKTNVKAGTMNYGAVKFVYTKQDALGKIG